MEMARSAHLMSSEQKRAIGREIIKKHQRGLEILEPFDGPVMDHLLWEAHQDDGTMVERWSPEGEEQVPDPWATRQFHLWIHWSPAVDTHIHIPLGGQFRCGTRGSYFYAGWEMPDVSGAWLFVNADGQTELSPWEMHKPRWTK